MTHWSMSNSRRTRRHRLAGRRSTIIAPADLPDDPYFICVDHEKRAKAIREWLPDTRAIFHLSTEHRGKTNAPGFLGFAELASQSRKRLLLRRLSVLRRVDKLMDLARGTELPLILMYGDPDPDAIGAALGLATIWKAAGAQPLIRYTGEIQRYQNRLMIQYLKEPIERMRESERLGADLIAVVDAQPGFWKREDERPHAHVVIDHHPKRDDTQALYVDIREDYGSTASIFTDYLVEAGFPINRKLATALLYGLKTDTADLSRNTHSADVKAFDELHGKADQHFLDRLAKSQVPVTILDQISWGISHRLVYRDMLLGPLRRDRLARCAGSGRRPHPADLRHQLDGLRRQGRRPSGRRVPR